MLLVSGHVSIILGFAGFVLNSLVFKFAAILLLAHSGCQVIPTQDEPSPAPAVSQKATTEEHQIERLLEYADLAIQKDQLLYPKKNSAATYLSYILDLDPGNTQAKRGLEKIVERYVELSILAIDRKQFNRAQSMLDRARLIIKDHPSIKPAQTQLDLVSTSDIDILKLHSRDIDEKLSAQILSFGRHQSNKNCRFIISASSDQEGRLIYQKLKGFGETLKINAQIILRRPTKIERQCFQR